MLDVLKHWYQSLVLKLFLVLGTKVLGYNLVDIYSPKKDVVLAITFSVSKEYIKRLSKIK